MFSPFFETVSFSFFPFSPSSFSFFSFSCLPLIFLFSPPLLVSFFSPFFPSLFFSSFLFFLLFSMKDPQQRRFISKLPWWLCAALQRALHCRQPPSLPVLCLGVCHDVPNRAHMAPVVFISTLWHVAAASLFPQCWR